MTPATNLAQPDRDAKALYDLYWSGTSSLYDIQMHLDKTPITARSLVVFLQMCRYLGAHKE